MTGSFMGRGNEYVELVLTISKQLPTFPHRVRGPGKDKVCD